MPTSATHGAPYLMFRCGAVSAALPLAEVRETLRPLPVVSIESAPAFVLGMAIIRGLATVVVNGAELLDRTAVVPPHEASSGRFVSLRVPERPVALAVDCVLGIRELPADTVAGLPPLVLATEHGPIEHLANLDGELWMLLRAGRLVPDIAELGPVAAEMFA